MIETVIESIRVNLDTENRVVLLKERHGDRHLPIWIGDFEAQAIAMELQGMASPRPLPYDLLKSVLGELDAEVDRVLVTDLSQDVFYARIVVKVQDRTFEIDSRPSDAIAVAVRTSAPIFVEESVLERAGVSLEAESDSLDQEVLELVSDPAETKGDDTLSVFRDFINQLDRLNDERDRTGTT